MYTDNVCAREWCLHPQLSVLFLQQVGALLDLDNLVDEDVDALPLVCGAIQRQSCPRALARIRVCAESTVEGGDGGLQFRHTIHYHLFQLRLFPQRAVI